MKTLWISCIALIAVASYSGSIAQTTSTSEVKSLAKDTAALNFVEKATLGNLKEIETGRLAQVRTENKAVIDFGKRMITDHTNASDQMTKLLRSKNMNIPAPSVPIDEASKKLRNAKGKDFDKLYMTMMIADHKKTIALFENASQNVQDPEIKAFATQLLPKLMEHLDHANKIASEVNGSSPDHGSTGGHP